MSLLFNRVCLETKTSLQRGFRRTVFVTSTSDADKARMAVAGVVPAGSFCDEHGVWNVPDGSTIEVYNRDYRVRHQLPEVVQANH